MESPEQGLKLTLPVYAQVIRGQYERLKHVKSDNDILETASALKAFLSDPDAYGRETFNPILDVLRATQAATDSLNQAGQRLSKNQDREVTFVPLWLQMYRDLVLAVCTNIKKCVDCRLINLVPRLYQSVRLENEPGDVFEWLELSAQSNASVADVEDLINSDMIAPDSDGEDVAQRASSSSNSDLSSTVRGESNWLDEQSLTLSPNEVNSSSRGVLELTAELQRDSPTPTIDHTAIKGADDASVASVTDSGSVRPASTPPVWTILESSQRSSWASFRSSPSLNPAERASPLSSIIESSVLVGGVGDSADLSITAQNLPESPDDDDSFMAVDLEEHISQMALSSNAPPAAFERPIGEPLTDFRQMSVDDDVKSDISTPDLLDSATGFISCERGPCKANGVIKFNFEFDSVQELALHRWKNRLFEPLQYSTDALCVSLEILKYDDCPPALQGTYRYANMANIGLIACSWPDPTHDVYASLTSGVPTIPRYSARLSPPWTMGPDGRVDLTPHIQPGRNTVHFRITQSMPDCVFAVRMHPPTSAQMKELSLTKNKGTQLLKSMVVTMRQQVSNAFKIPFDDATSRK